MTSLVIVELDTNHIQAATYHTIAAAKALSGDVDLLVAGDDIDAMANLAAQTEGVRQVIKVNHASLQHALAESLSHLVLELAKDYDHILASATTFGKNLLPRVAAKLDVQMLSDIIEVVSPDTFKRPVYAGNAIATVQSHDAKKVMTVRATGFDATSAEGGQAKITSLDFDSSSFEKTTLVSQERTESERPELTSARVVISGGRGMQNGDNFKMLDEIADLLGAAVGASRAAVDAGFVPNDYQVGQTGKIVAPELYIAVGISGAIQHLAGMKDSKVIVAINKDEEAPIFQVADYGLVADLFDVLPQIKAALSS